MRFVTVLCVLLLGLPVVAQEAELIRDPQTYEPIPLGLTEPPSEVPRSAASEALHLLVHRPEGSTKAVRFLSTEPHAALVQNGAAVVAFTWSLPAHPGRGGDNAVELARHVFDFQPSDIFVDPVGRAFVTLRQGGMKILDAAVPTDLIPRGSTTEFDALAVVADGGFAYVGAGFAGLRVFDVGDVDFPDQIGTVVTGGSANGLHLQDDLLFVANGNPDGVDNFLIFDVSQPAQPQLVGGFNPPGFVTNVIVQGDVAFLTGAFGLVVLDVSDPAAPAQIGSFAAGGETTYEAAILGDRMSLVGLAGLFVLDITDPANPILVDATTAGQALSTDIAMVETSEMVLVGDRFHGAIAKHLFEGSYVTLSFYGNGGFSHKATFANNRLYVTDLAGGLRIFNVTEAHSGVVFQLSHVTLPSNTQWPLVADGFAYVADADFGESGLTVVDVSVSATPQVVGSWSSTNQAFGLDIDGDVLYVANGFGGLVSIDVSDPEEPQTIGSLPLGSNVVDVAVKDDVAFVVSFGGGMIAVDVADPAAMTVISQRPEWGFLNAIDLGDPGVFTGDYAFVADGQQGLRMVDVSNPANMTTFMTSPTATQARDVAVGYGFFDDITLSAEYVADDFFGLRVFHYGEEFAAFRTADRGIGVASDGSYEFELVALASGETGVYVFRGPHFVSTEDDLAARTPILDAIYPNPARGVSTIRFHLSQAGDAEVELFDILGRRLGVVASGTFTHGTHEVALDVSDLAVGVYVVRLTAGGESATRRITVVR